MSRIIIASIFLLLSLSSYAVDTFPEGVKVAGKSVQLNSEQAIEDKDGIQWFLSPQDGLYAYDGENYVKYFPSKENPRSISSYNVNCLYYDKGGRLWVGTQKGIDLLEEDKMGFRHYTIPGINNYVSKIMQLSDGRILAITMDSILEYQPEEDKFVERTDLPFYSRGFFCLQADDRGGFWMIYNDVLSHMSPSYELKEIMRLDSRADKLVFDGYRTLYILSSGRVSLVDAESGTLMPVPAFLSFPGPVTDMCSDGKRMMLFLCKGSLHCYEIPSRTFSSSYSQELPFSIPVEVSEITSIQSDMGGNIWVENMEGALLKVVEKKGDGAFDRLSHYIGNRTVITSTSEGNSFVALLDDGTLFRYSVSRREVLDEWQTGDYSNLSKLLYWRTNSFHLQVIGQSVLLSVINGAWIFPFSKDGVPGGAVRNLFQDNDHFMEMIVQGTDGSFWIAGQGTSFSLSSEQNGTLIPIKKGSVGENRNVHATDMIPMRNGDVAIAFSDMGVFLVSPEDMTPRLIQLPQHHDQMFVSSLLEDGDGRLWIGTTDWGLFRYDPLNFQTSKIVDFADKRVWNIVQEGESVYILAESSIYEYDRSSDSFKMLWADPLESPEPVNMFSFPEGKIILDNHGEYSVLKTSDEKRTSIPDAKVNMVLTSDSKVLAMRVMSEEDNEFELRTKVFPSALNILLSLMDDSVGPVIYQFRINSSATEKNSLSNHPMLIYGLHYGTNKIIFKARAMQGDFESEAFLLKVVIPRPWYHYAAFLCLLLGICSLATLLVQRNKKRKEAEEALLEKRRQEEINAHNIDFFANISHEFRTPLTLIDGAAGSLPSNPPEAGRMKMIIRRNTDRMLKLVNQMLDFNKLDHDMLRLKVTISDATSIVRRVAEQFRFGASQKDLDLEVEVPSSPVLMWVDADKLEKILYNLLSNALKFTPPGGTVTINASTVVEPASGIVGQRKAGHYFQVCVKDTGVGIPEDKKSFIFERFAQTDSAKKSGGTGIGLYFTKALVELHHGGIFADNRDDLPENMSGSVFCFALPMDESCYTEEERSEDVDTNVSAESMRSMSEYLVSEGIRAEEEKIPLILVIDDDYEMVYFLKALLSPLYRVSCRFDAMSGYKVLESESPDLIISDVMMTEVDGLQLCRMAKENFSTSHVPVILLTAKSTVEDQIKGLGAGADAYVIKPFNKEYFLALVKSQLDNRKRVQRMFKTITGPDDIEDGLVSSMDKSLMDNLYKLIEKSLPDGEINIDDVAYQLGVSRTKFYSKIKSLTGQTPNELFNTYKLNMAAGLIKEGKFKIAAIASMMGFNSASYFANLFKKQFGMLPSQYMEKFHQDEIE